MCQTVSAWTGLPWVRPSGVFLVTKEVRSRGWRAGPEAHESPRAMGSFVFLCHAPDVTLLRSSWQGQALGATPESPSTSVVIEPPNLYKIKYDCPHLTRWRAHTFTYINLVVRQVSRRTLVNQHHNQDHVIKQIPITYIELQRK